MLLLLALADGFRGLVIEGFTPYKVRLVKLREVRLDELDEVSLLEEPGRTE